MYYCSGISEKGNVREKNEDAFLINHTVMGGTDSSLLEGPLTAPFIAAVADGVGGERCGERAARLCLELLSNIKFSSKVNLSKKVLEIHEGIRRYGMAHKECMNMQTTLCALAADENGKVYTVNVGDSRIYRYRGGELSQVTTDQSLVQMLYDAGKITDFEKRTHAQRNVIMPVMGNISEKPTPDVRLIEGGICHGDVFLLCSDGLSDYLPIDEMEEIMAEPLKLTKRLRMLCDKALGRGSKDNITVVGLTAQV